MCLFEFYECRDGAYQKCAFVVSIYILNQTISHGGAAEILGIRKSELIDIYDKLGYSYLDMTMDELDSELETFRQMKKKEAAE